MTPNDNNFWQEEEADLDLKGLVFKYLRYWYWFVISLIICLGAAFLYLKFATPIYKVNATLLVKDEKKGATLGNDMMADLDVLGGSKLVENEIEVLKSRALIGKVVDQLNLTVTYRKEGSIRDEELYAAESPLKINVTSYTAFAYEHPLYIRLLKGNQYELLSETKKKLGAFDYSESITSDYGKFRVFKNVNLDYKDEDPVKVVFHNRDKLIGNLIEGLDVALLTRNSTVISLGLETPVKQKGKDIMSRILEEYSFSSLEDKNREATNTLRFIEGRLKLITTELGDVEQDVEQFRRSRGITNLSTEANLFLEKVKDNDTKLNEVDIQLKILDGVDRYLQSDQAGNVAPATLMVNDPVLTSYINQLSQLELEREKLSRSAQASNPFMQTIDTQMRNVKQAIRENVNSQKTGLQVTKNSLVSLNNRLEGAISTIPKKEREFVEIKRQAGIKENLYLLLLKKREETALSYASTVTDSRVVDHPFDSGDPVKPKKMIIALAGLFLGLILPLTAITIRDMLINTVQTRQEIEDKTGVSVFGEIGQKPREEKGQILDVKSRSFVSEQVRMIRSNLSFLFSDIKEDEGKVIMITSSTGGEGKSFVASNIAASLGLLDLKVVILGLDLRKPKIDEYLNVPNTRGISNYLVGKVSEEEIIQKTALANVFIIPSGPIPPNPSELIMNGRIRELIEVLKNSFDYVLIDTAPTALVTDAVLLAPYADACFYLVRHESTPRQFLNNLAELHQKKIFKSLSVIFNAVNYKNLKEYGYGYNYGYGYGDAYSKEKPKNGLKNWFGLKK